MLGSIGMASTDVLVLQGFELLLSAELVGLIDVLAKSGQIVTKITYHLESAVLEYQRAEGARRQCPRVARVGLYRCRCTKLAQSLGTRPSRPSPPYPARSVWAPNN